MGRRRSKRETETRKVLVYNSKEHKQENMLFKSTYAYNVNKFSGDKLMRHIQYLFCGLVHSKIHRKGNESK